MFFPNETFFKKGVFIGSSSIFHWLLLRFSLVTHHFSLAIFSKIFIGTFRFSLVTFIFFVTILTLRENPCAKRAEFFYSVFLPYISAREAAEDFFWYFEDNFHWYFQFFIGYFQIFFHW